MDVDPVLRDVRRERGLLARHVDPLDAHVQVVRVLLRIVGHGASAQFHRVRRNARHLHLHPRDVGSLAESLFDGLPVARFVVEGEIARHFLVELRRTGIQCLFGRNHGRQIPVFDFDQLGRVLRRRNAVGNDHRHRVAHVADPVDSERWTPRFLDLLAVTPGRVQHHQELVVAGAQRVFSGIDELHPRMLRGFCDVDGHDLGMRPVRAQEMRIELAGEAPVGGVLAGPRNEAEILDSAVRMGGVRVQGAEVQPVCLLGAGSGGLYIPRVCPVHCGRSFIPDHREPCTHDGLYAGSRRCAQ